MNALVSRLGVIGCGMIGRKYASRARSMPGLAITAAYSPSDTSRATLLALWPTARSHAERDSLLDDPDVDGVLVCSPHAAHAADAIAAIEAGKHVLVEKPIATSLSDLDSLKAADERRGDAAVLALPLVDTFLDRLRPYLGPATGPLVEIRSVLDVPGPPRSNWYYSRAAVGGPTLDTLPYALGRLLALSGSVVSEAVALVSKAIERRLCADGVWIDQEVEDQVTLLLSLPTGQQAIAKSSWCIHRPEDYLLVRGRHGDVRVDYWRKRLLVRSRDLPQGLHRASVWDGDPAIEVDLPETDPEDAKLEAFLDLIRAGGSTLPQTAYALRLVLGALEQRAGKIAVPLPAGPGPTAEGADGSLWLVEG